MIYELGSDESKRFWKRVDNVYDAYVTIYELAITNLRVKFSFNM